MLFQNLQSKVKSLLAGPRKIWAAVVVMVMTFCLLTSFVVMKINNVTVYENGKEVASFTTFESENEKLLAAAGLEIGESDIVERSGDGREIRLDVTHAFCVYIDTAAEKITVKANEGATVADVLAIAGVEYEESDKLSAKPEDAVTADMTIELIRTVTKTIKETEIIPFESETKKSDTLYVGTTSVAQEGKNGEITKTYKVVYEDGKEVSRTLISKEETKKAQKKITLEGTKVKAPASFGAKMSKAELAGAKLINVTATAYCNESDGGQITALGNKTGFGIVAVDPRVIPLGSKLYITSADGSYVYGYCIAGDTGGAIKGNRVDLFLGSESECRAFGRRPMQVYVLG